MSGTQDMGEIKIRGPKGPVQAGEAVLIKTLIKHPMESGRRKDAGGQLIPAHFIRTVTVRLGGEEQMTAQWTGGVSKNPFLSFWIKAPATTQTLEITWEDNLGGVFSGTLAIDVA